MTLAAEFDLVVSVHGTLDDRAVAYAGEKVRDALETAPAPILFARVTLKREGNPSLQRPCIAKAHAEIDGRNVRAHVAARTMTEAIDLLDARLRRRLERMAERLETRRRETGIADPGEWRHGDLPELRPEFFPRPVEERRIVRRKTYALRALSPEEAAWEMELLDHDFHLFTEAASDAEAVVFRRGDGAIGMQILEGSPIPTPTGGAPFVPEAAPAATMNVPEAIEELNLADGSFVFFRDRQRGRGSVVYRRYDGHYGIVGPG